jgi:hypothetical protein
MAWRCGLLPLVPANTAAFLHPTHRLICAQVIPIVATLAILLPARINAGLDLLPHA